jgi:hypothetical protein
MLMSFIMSLQNDVKCMTMDAIHPWPAEGPYRRARGEHGANVTVLATDPKPFAE